MSERKVLNKYYPPDFDPSKIPRLRLPRDRQYTVRLMAPCNMRCTTCGEYIYKGKKFNARKETVQNEEYLGIKIFRFYIKCPRCLAEITFKTDPENADYIVEHGATRNFQALKLAEEAAAKEAKELEEEEKNNPMKLLENRTQASKQEMELMETLEELKDLNQRHAKVDIENLLVDKQQQLIDEIKRQEDEDEAVIRSVFGKSEGKTVKRIIEEDEEEEISNNTVKKSTESMSKKTRLTGASIGILSSKSKENLVKLKTNVAPSLNTSSNDNSKISPNSNSKPVVSKKLDNLVIVRKKSESVVTIEKKEKSAPSALSLLGTYSDSDADSS
ncbi:splicing factor YJU2 [Trichonephila inaurata madagascariensis]|uniref:Splicing factor YJU2 n=1 Tax=Trichonephila inaurata madagascariensis TaxID=2747483 RepID=A0A8X7CPZ3_9ARAC|nr:splicing factor YJU2 [Trichonephila inaurata madagascariensis]